jgi:hypothetical protein
VLTVLLVLVLVAAGLVDRVRDRGYQFGGFTISSMS